MAPVKATAVGIAPQAIDDSELSTLLETLNNFELNAAEDIENASTDEINRLVSVVEPYPEWQFEEQVSNKKEVLSYQNSDIRDPLY